jgi:hypothetical protein
VEERKENKTMNSKKEVGWLLVITAANLAYAEGFVQNFTIIYWTTHYYRLYQPLEGWFWPLLLLEFVCGIGGMYLVEQANKERKV